MHTVDAVSGTDVTDSSMLYRAETKGSSTLKVSVPMNPTPPVDKIKAGNQ